MPTDEATLLNVLARHLRNLIDLTDDTVAMIALAACANDLSERASVLAEEAIHRQIAAQPDPDDPQVS